METPIGLTREDFATLLVKVVTQGQQASSVAAVARALPKPYRLSSAALRVALDDLVGRQQLFLWPGRRRRYAKVPWGEHVAARVLATLATGPKSAAQLAREAAIPRTAVAAALHDLLAEGRAFKHPALGRSRPFGATPADPLPYLRGGLEQLVRSTVKKGFARDAVTEALARALAVSPPRADEGQVLLAALARLDPQVEAGALVYLPHLRASVADRVGDKHSFDRTVLALAAQRRVQVQTHPVPSQLTAAEREAMVPNGTGGYYMAIGLRRE